MNIDKRSKEVIKEVTTKKEMSTNIQLICLKFV